MGFKFSIEYKFGASNKVADALSRRDEEIADSEILSIYARPMPAIMEVLLSEYTTLPDLVELRKLVEKGSAPAHISAVDGALFF